MVIKRPALIYTDDNSWDQPVNIQIWDWPSLDAFWKQRVASPFTLFDSKLLDSKKTFLWSEAINWTATSIHTQSEARVRMTVNANWDYVIRQTFMRFNYQPWKSLNFLCTFDNFWVTTNVQKKVWYFNSSTTAPYTDTLDGLYLDNNGTDIAFVISKNWTQNRITQETWNIDTMDWNWPSWINLDFDKNIILFVDFEWLWVWRVRFWFVKWWAVYYAHNKDHVQDIETWVYMSSPNHSVRYEIRSTWWTDYLDHICSTVISEWLYNASGQSWVVSTWLTWVATTAASTYILTWIRSSINYSSSIIPKLVSVLSTTWANARWMLVMNPTLTSWSVSWAAKTWFWIEEWTPTNALVNDPWYIIAEWFFSSDSDSYTWAIKSLVLPWVSIDWTRDDMFLLINNLSWNETYYWSLNFIENL